MRDGPSRTAHEFFTVSMPNGTDTHKGGNCLASRPKRCILEEI